MKKQLMLTTMLALGLGGVVTTAWAQTVAPAGQDTVDEVVVTGFRSSLQKSLNLKRDAIVVRDSIVAEDIGKFPEANVAEALQRIPGVYLSRDGASNEGQRISIRGLGSDYNVTTINGAPVRATSSSNVGGSSRDFNYDVFASELFGRVDFYKTPLAELEEGGIGGVVDLQTPRPFDSPGRHIRYQVVGSYNDKSKHLDPAGFALISNTWGNFGALFALAHSKSVNNRSGFEATGGYNSHALGSQSPNKGPFAVTLDFADPRYNRGSLTQAQIENGYLPRFYRYYGGENTRERTGAVGSLQYQNDKLNISVDGLYSKLQDSLDEYTFGLPIRNSKTTNTAAQAGGPGHNGLVPINVTLDTATNLLEGAFGNTSYLGESYFYNSQTEFKLASFDASYQLTDKLKVTAQGSLSKSDAYFTGNRLIANLYGVTTTIGYTDDHVYPGLSAPGVDFTNPNNYQDFGVGFDWRREIDKEKTAKLFADWDYGLFGVEGHLKGGFSYVSTRKNTTKRNATAAGTAKINTLGATALRAAMLREVPLDNLVIGSGYPQAWATFSRDYVMSTFDPIGTAKATPIDFNASFGAEEEIKTAFVQSDLKREILDRELRVNVGVRYSETNTHIDNYLRQTNGAVTTYVPNQADGSYKNTLPSASFAYDVTDKLIWRGSWGKTITRASLSIIAANTVIPNIYDTRATSGNPDLLPQTSTNYDTGVEWYFGRGGILSAGFFWKELKDTTVSTTTTVPFSSLGLPDTALAPIFQNPATGKVDPSLPITLATYYNQGSIKLDGYELAYQQSFDFLPGIWSGLGALASFTHVNTSGYDYKTTGGKILNVNTVPKYSYSLTGYYEKGPFGLRLSYNYKAKNIIETTNNGSDLQRWHSGVGFLDGNATYKINDSIEVRLDALNLTNALTYDYFDDVSGRYGDGRKTRMDYAKYNGRTIKFGVRGRF
ncbi:TonB-dependent receptor [Caulobacter sp. BP25]|uniref:TonB-dependent receptor n=1 Tax=Caulobacter sp. BP25 TaxID=2048900 RepID=UPI000C12D81F|nr:TonB-dependent receptor [Caulobacter sp. BP25]PHY20847.1 TonB-dependent receptor [Caulobacter sp. BP25]